MFFIITNQTHLTSLCNKGVFMVITFNKVYNVYILNVFVHDMMYINSILYP